MDYQHIPDAMSAAGTRQNTDEIAEKDFNTWALEWGSLTCILFTIFTELHMALVNVRTLYTFRESGLGSIVDPSGIRASRIAWHVSEDCIHSNHLEGG